MNINSTYFTIIFLLLFTPLLYGAEIVVQVGVASPQSEFEEKNTEKLRERAIRNAMELSVFQVSGVLITVEKGDTSRAREDTIISGDKIVEQTSQQRRSHGNVVSRSSAYARLVEIIREWRENNQYFVEAKFEVYTPKETTQKLNAGYFWERVGKPSIALSFNEKTNGEVTTKDDAPILPYLRDNLVENGITVSTEEISDIKYLIKVVQTFQTQYISNFDTYSTSCHLSFQIVDQKRGKTVAEYRAKHGPEAGFSIEQAQERCVKAIAPEISKNMVRSIADVMNDRWNNGVEYNLSIENIPGNFITEASDIIKTLFQVTSSAGISYQNNILQITIRYKSTGTDLSEAVQTSFAESGWETIPLVVQDNEVRLRWVKQNY